MEAAKTPCHTDGDGFTLIDTDSLHQVLDDYEDVYSGRIGDPDTYLQRALRKQYPELSLTVTFTNNVPLLKFAAAGYATAELDIKDEGIQRIRHYIPSHAREGQSAALGESRSFAKYNYKWADEYFVVYIVQIGFYTFQYILKEPGDGETTMSVNTATDQLVRVVGGWSFPDDDQYIYVYDSYWRASKNLYNQVTKAKWEDVILNETMKKDLTNLMHKFFDSEDIYKDLGVAWKRGVIFHGPDTIVTPNTRSYFFNEVDGLENNDGIFMVASTNHLDQLDPGLSSRPSRFDRKYFFPLPDLHERTLYCEYWRNKLASKPTIKYPERLCPAIAKLTEGFSFAYLKEAFVATLVVIAGNRSEDDTSAQDKGEDDDDLEKYELWREIRKQIKLLRGEMGNGDALPSYTKSRRGSLPSSEASSSYNGGRLIRNGVSKQTSDPQQCQLPLRRAGQSPGLPFLIHRETSAVDDPFGAMHAQKHLQWPAEPDHAARPFYMKQEQEDQQVYRPK
ncbi:uncharacterized protein KY384_006591 [Bacidia gigantensis]|uniref:uncharacterized protein n=1 Tax=Bacidia gigantensis TaxID=2732470 RepID=UPI001D056392|nr:uncharacterized protein KY384_006591 [Bacidia gigantensis]KAG8528902.1 hypothetical protein KY384_006591 [Bacidia gigantensis]